jgi:hypothetical protein
MKSKEGYLENKQKDLAIHIQDMLECAQNVKACSERKYSDIHSRILELESSIRRIVILSYQIKALKGEPPFNIEGY